MRNAMMASYMPPVDTSPMPRGYEQDPMTAAQREHSRRTIADANFRPYGSAIASGIDKTAGVVGGFLAPILNGDLHRAAGDYQIGERAPNAMLPRQAFDAAGGVMMGSSFAQAPKNALRMGAALNSKPQPPSLPPQQRTDRLGFYSQAVEAAKALKQAKGTPEQMLSQLRKSGVKQAEIDATGLAKFLEGQKTVTKNGLVAFLELQRVPLKEATYVNYGAMGADQLPSDLTKDAAARTSTKWSQYSLDPSNPTYRETVLNLPPKWADDGMGGKVWDPNETFRNGHFDEPNVISHLRTSIQPDADGRQNFVINELQSDWGQKIRNGGGPERNQENIRLASESEKKFKEAKSIYESRRRDKVEALKRGESSEDIGKLIDLESAAYNDLNLRRAEFETFKNTAPGNPLVNTTDQWVNTSLRRALRQAVDEGADNISIASGETVDGFKMGAPLEGLQYAYNEMYPKKLAKIMQKYDKSVNPYNQNSMLGSQGGGSVGLGNGFTSFPITPAVREAVLAGQPLFSNPFTGAVVPTFTAPEE